MYVAILKEWCAKMVPIFLDFKNLSKVRVLFKPKISFQGCPFKIM